jgi:hypothetical protein
MWRIVVVTAVSPVPFSGNENNNARSRTLMSDDLPLLHLHLAGVQVASSTCVQ